MENMTNMMSAEERANVTRKEFFASYASKKALLDVRSGVTLCWICAVITLALGLYLGAYSALIDVALLGGLALWLQKSKSRVCAWVITALGAYNTISSIISTGMLSGWWVLLAGIAAVIGANKLHKEYQAFVQDGTIPVNEEPVSKKRKK